MRNEKSIIHCCVERDVYDMLTRHCEKTGQTKTTAVKRAILAYCSAAGRDGGTENKNSTAQGGGS